MELGRGKDGRSEIGASGLDARRGFAALLCWLGLQGHGEDAHILLGEREGKGPVVEDISASHEVTENMPQGTLVRTHQGLGQFSEPRGSA